MFNGKSFIEKFLLMTKYNDFARVINCTLKTYLREPACAGAIAHISGNSMIVTENMCQISEKNKPA